MAQKFIDDTPFRIWGFIKRQWPQPDARIVQVDIPGIGEFVLSPRGAKRLSSLLWDEATKVEKAKP